MRICRKRDFPLTFKRYLLSVHLSLRFKRLDVSRADTMRGSRSAQRHARMNQLKRFKYPTLAILTSLAAFSLYEQSTIARLAGKAPATNLGWQSFGAAYSSRTGSSNAEAASALDTNQTANSGNWWEDDEYNDEYDGFAAEPTAEIWVGTITWRLSRANSLMRLHTY